MKYYKPFPVSDKILGFTVRRSEILCAEELHLLLTQCAQKSVACSLERVKVCFGKKQLFF